ncbi:elongation of very long chain fatty acids protein 7-like isoform X2 [Varroa jacobsoni]|uniref:elongation of very long chain fatty acids protein 7-like isoform X2 n=1 Tax=Varroa jacobsoni TaxID=62625 RepID=UPI000BF79041|nr:elongation of very long chain fatty acids protein 7-like isoform X2 [Varroa jacobsoni]
MDQAKSLRAQTAKMSSEVLGPIQSPFFSSKDQRTEGWLMLDDPKLLITILACYVYLVKRAIPSVMANRKPFELVWSTRLYSLIMVASNVYFLCRTLPLTYFGGGYSFLCQGVDYDDRSSRTMEVIGLMHSYLFVRIFDFVGTIIYALQKKFYRISLFHVYHHCASVTIGVYGLTYGVEGQAVFGVCVNMCVHIILYTYIFLATFGPRLTPYLTWKRYLDKIELAQFLIITLHILMPVFVRTCSYPVQHSLSGISMIALMTVLFMYNRRLA